MLALKTVPWKLKRGSRQILDQTWNCLKSQLTERKISWVVASSFVLPCSNANDITQNTSKCQLETCWERVSNQFLYSKAQDLNLCPQ